MYPLVTINRFEKEKSSSLKKHRKFDSKKHYFADTELEKYHSNKNRIRNHTFFYIKKLTRPSTIQIQTTQTVKIKPPISNRNRPRDQHTSSDTNRRANDNQSNRYRNDIYILWYILYP